MGRCGASPGNDRLRSVSPGSLGQSTRPPLARGRALRRSPGGSYGTGVGLEWVVLRWRVWHVVVHASAACTLLFTPVHDSGDQAKQLDGSGRNTVRSSKLRPTIETGASRSASLPVPTNGISPGQTAEDRRFELLRGCPQHAFQQCWPAFTGVRHRTRTARTRSGWPLVNGGGQG